MEEIKASLALSNNSNIVNDTIYRKLLENCFSVLSGNAETHNLTSLYNSKADVVKEIYARLLSITAEFVRNNQTKDQVVECLSKECGFNQSRAAVYSEFYENHKRDVEMALLNIGNHLPHVTDVEWKIDYIVKSNTLDESEGPLFRISLLTEKFDPSIGTKKQEFVNFTCTTQELQDLVYKLKDAIRHCQRLTQD